MLEQKIKENKFISKGIILPGNFSVLLTQKCNLKCDFCEFDCSPEKSAALDINDFKKLLVEGKKNGISTVVLDGGEPLVYKDIIEALRLCAVYGYQVVLLTNGWYFRNYLSQFKKYNVGHFVFGINGATAKINDRIMGKRGAFERVVDAIKISKHLGFYTGLNFVFHPLNIKEIPYFIKLAKRWRVDRIKILRIVEVGRAKNRPEIRISPFQIKKMQAAHRQYQKFLGNIPLSLTFENENRHLQCKYLAAKQDLAIHWNGQIALCAMVPLLNLPFKKICDSSLIKCLRTLDKIRQKFQVDRNKEYPYWRLSENPYFTCEYCHGKLTQNFRHYFNIARSKS